MEKVFTPVNLKQGGRGWLAYRANKKNASDAPAAMAVSLNRSRRSLVRQLATGITPEFSQFMQDRVLQKGHDFEHLAGPLMEQHAGVQLFPVVGYLGDYSASYDGLSMDWTIAAEHKTLNEALRECMFDGCTGTDLPIYHQVQMEHQCMVNEAIERVLFMASKWTPQGELIEERHCWYTPNLKLRGQILAAWESVEQDARDYDPADDEPEALEKKVHEQLPVLNIDVHGQVLASNLGDFERVVKQRITAIATELTTDQEFADAIEDARWLRDVADKMAAAVKAAREKMVDVDALFKMLEGLETLADSKALALEKKVKKEKEERKAKIVTDAQADLDQHIKALNAQLGSMWMKRVIGPFDATIKGRSSLDNMRDLVAGALSVCKADASAQALRFTTNRAHLLQNDVDWISLFPDFATVGDKEPADFQGLALLRITQHQKAQEEAEAAKRAREAAAAAPAPVAAPTPAPASFTPPAPPPDGSHMAATRPMLGLFSEPTNVVAMRTTPPAARTSVPTLRIGVINDRLQHFTVTAEGLKGLGFEPAGRERAAPLYHDDEFPAMCQAIAARAQAAAQEHATAQATA